MSKTSSMLTIPVDQLLKLEYEKERSMRWEDDKIINYMFSTSKIYETFYFLLQYIRQDERFARKLWKKIFLNKEIIHGIVNEFVKLNEIVNLFDYEEKKTLVKSNYGHKRDEKVFPSITKYYYLRHIIYAISIENPSLLEILFKSIVENDLEYRIEIYNLVAADCTKLTPSTLKINFSPHVEIINTFVKNNECINVSNNYIVEKFLDHICYYEEYLETTKIFFKIVEEFFKNIGDFGNGHKIEIDFDLEEDDGCYYGDMTSTSNIHKSEIWLSPHQDDFCEFLYKMKKYHNWVICGSELEPEMTRIELRECKDQLKKYEEKYGKL